VKPGWLRKLTVAGLLAVSLASFAYVGLVLRARGRGRDLPLNVLVLSFCSFRYQMLSHYAGHPMNWLPAFEEFFAGSSYIFDNAFNGLGWTGVFTYTRQRIPPEVFHDRGYHLLGTVEEGHLLRIPYRRSRLDDAGPELNDNDFEKDHQADTNYLPSVTSSLISKPFFLVAHYKYMHYPLIDGFNAESDWDYFLTPSERRQISEYLNHPEKYPEKMPFLVMLSDDPRVVLANPAVQEKGWKDDPESRLRLMGLLTNPKFLKIWKESPGYQDDMRLLEKVYRGNARYLDSVLRPALNLWGDEELKRNTVLVVLADHGEMHMERDQLTHGYSLYDEALKVPLAIRFPDQSGRPVVVKDQVDFTTVAKLIEGILKGEIRRGNLPEKLRRINDGVMLARDCLNATRGLRYDNKYKYFVRVADAQRFLFDLEKDPGESVNLAPAQPEVADRMEALYWNNYSRFSNLDPYHCASWQQ
jgi:arylsulfatase A-like enzyme